MQGLRWPAWAMLAAVTASGCQATSPPRQTVAATEPGLTLPAEPGKATAAAPPEQTLTFVDRHPLFWKPREYYESSGNNRVVKTAAAAVIGIPAGIIGELRQIVAGVPVVPKQ